LAALKQELAKEEATVKALKAQIEGASGGTAVSAAKSAQATRVAGLQKEQPAASKAKAVKSWTAQGNVKTDAASPSVEYSTAFACSMAELPVGTGVVAVSAVPVTVFGAPVVGSAPESVAPANEHVAFETQPKAPGGGQAQQPKKAKKGTTAKKESVGEPVIEASDAEMLAALRAPPAPSPAPAPQGARAGDGFTQADAPATMCPVISADPAAPQQRAPAAPASVDVDASNGLMGLMGITGSTKVMADKAVRAFKERKDADAETHKTYDLVLAKDEVVELAPDLQPSPHSTRSTQQVAADEKEALAGEIGERLRAKNAKVGALTVSVMWCAAMCHRLHTPPRSRQFTGSLSLAARE
jgi:hypothetical protein